MNGIELRRKVARLKAEKAAEVERSMAEGVCDSVMRMTPGSVRASNRVAVSNFLSVVSKVMAIVMAVLVVALIFVPRAPV